MPAALAQPWPTCHFLRLKSLVYFEQHATDRSHSTREEHQTLVAQMEDRFDPFNELRLA
jgi:hypothetical protein